ncbi:MAG: MerR family transcriptional regulator [Chloroflexota bacterium]
MNTYKTLEVAKIVGIHPNTVRLYEKYRLIPEAKRQDNGYRIFTDFHIQQMKLARTALQVEVLQNGLRKRAITIIKTSATGDFDSAIFLTKEFIQNIKAEQQQAEDAIFIASEILNGKNKNHKPKMQLLRREAAAYLQITTDTLRNWELNGLISIKKKQNGYRIYSDEDIRKLKIIRSLRCANYSLASILRLMRALSFDPNINIKNVIDTPDQRDEIITACDHLLTSLRDTEKIARGVLTLLQSMQLEFGKTLQ